MYLKAKGYDKTVIKFYFITFIIEMRKKMSEMFCYFHQEKWEEYGLKSNFTMQNM